MRNGRPALLALPLRAPWNCLPLHWRLAWRQLRRFPARTALLLGLGGLAAALLIAALNFTAAGRQQLLAQLNDWGANLLTITPTLSRSVGGRARTGAIVTTLRAADLAALRRAAPAITGSAQVSTAAGLAKAGDFARNNANIAGVGPDYFRLRRWPTSAGRWLNLADNRRAARVATLGADIARALFPATPPVGQHLLINRVPFTVVGVLTARGQRLDAVNEDDQIYVPFATLEHRLLNRDFDSALLLAVASPDALAGVADRAAGLLRRRHHLLPGMPDDFQILTQQTLVAARAAAGDRLRQLVEVAGAGGLLATALALWALHLLAFGARRTEFAIRRALGATAANLRAQLAAEAALLAAATAGLALGAGALFTRLAEHRAALPWSWDGRAAVLVVALACALDLGATLGPAWRLHRRRAESEML
ncbi:MAG: ABC transporter permease [Terriglobales bacterium]